MIIKLNAFAFKHTLLFIRRQDDASGGTAPLRIDHAVPGRIVFIGAMHDKSDRPRRITLTEHVGDLTVSHDAAARNSPHDAIDAFAIFGIRLFSFPLRHFACLDRSEHRPRRRTIATTVGNLERQTNQLVITGWYFSEIQSFDDDHAARQQCQMGAVMT